ncbi:exo-alpha-sialidase [Halorubrum ezzemoulense]|nr:exo-alpha-sialidase [Halorubrum ezzemoulense]MDB9250071.1 exo-alpha-sialidase [Halorubrum ezzemoulense]MDB9260239.1 exo-alpha-sialidase [Halorubrum ezzemoulense]MDB9263535.1 exo-alpha-sialidase [Halorubrum ezzemoulense]MDB9267205.1 exo-alpha-sialidase [Halorubrum ezzemoulense]MDB9270600.1 exo-alpha-sialidase [Halorubrum ezzemoulense]
MAPGRTNQLTLQVINDGEVDLGTPQTREVVTTARNVRLSAEADDSSLTVETETLALGAVTETRPREAPIAVTVPNGTEPGNYELEVELEYSYTFQFSSGVTYDRTETVTADVDVEVSNDARFRIVDVTTDAQVGDRGTLDATIKNVGATAAHDATVALESLSSGLALGQRASDAALVGSIAPGEEVTVPYDVSFTPTAPVREYALSGQVSFETPDGIPRADQGLSAGVTPLSEQTFAIEDVESTLRVGEDGELTGTVENTGPVAANNVVIQYADTAGNLIPIEQSAAVGSLDSGESTSFILPLSVGGAAEPGLRTIDVAVAYRNDEGATRAYSDVVVNAEVAPERDSFSVAVENRSIDAGGTRTIEVTVTNELGEPASDLEARLFANDPLETGDTDTGYVQSLGAGESTTMTFELSTTDSATPGSTYPISLDFRYDDVDGDSQLSDTYRVPIGVTASEGGGLPLPIILIGTLIVGTGGLIFYRRRQ